MSDPSSIASNLEHQALEDFREGNSKAAVSGFRAALDGHQKDGNLIKAAEMRNNLCVALLQAERPREALEVVRPTPAFFASQGDQLRTAQAYGNLATALEATGDIAEAEASYKQAAELFGETGDNEGLSHTMKALSQLQLKHGKMVEAVASMQASLDGSERPSLVQRFLRWLMGVPSRLMGN